MHSDHEDQDRPYDWTVKAPPIPVPRRLSRPHPIVRATSDGAVGRRADADGRLTIGPRKGVIYTRVSRPLLGRALRIAQGLISEANRRGWDVAPVEKSAYGYRAGAAIVIGSHSTASRSTSRHRPSRSQPRTSLSGAASTAGATARRTHLRRNESASARPASARPAPTRGVEGRRYAASTILP